MAIINYAREWQRIASELEKVEIKLKRQLAMADTEEERRLVNVNLEHVQAQIDRAITQAARLDTRRGFTKTN